MSLAEAGKVEEAQREFLFIRRGGRAARAVVAKEKQSVLLLMWMRVIFNNARLPFSLTQN